MVFWWDVWDAHCHFWLFNGALDVVGVHECNVSFSQVVFAWSVFVFEVAELKQVIYTCWIKEVRARVNQELQVVAVKLVILSKLGFGSWRQRT